MKDEEFILGLLLSYSMIVVNETQGDNRNTQWFKVSETINKIIEKRKVPRLTKSRSVDLLAKYRKCKDFDLNYFEDKDFSAFVICILLLNYAIKENSCLFCRSKLSQIDTMKYIEELERSEQWRGLIKSHHRYLTLLIENV